MDPEREDPLIFFKLVEIARYDTVATAATGMLRGRLRDLGHTNANDGITPRTSARDGNETIVRLRAQIETGATEDMQQGPLGDTPVSRRVLVFAMFELEQLGLVDPTTKKPLLKKTDRLHAIYEPETEELIETIANPPGLFAHHSEPVGFGYGVGGPNLLAVHFEDRSQGTRGAG